MIPGFILLGYAEAVKVRALALLVATGCGRLGFEPRSDSTGALVDVSVDAAPEQLEILAVPADGSEVVSTTALRVGVAYELRVSGTFYIAGGTDPYGDADYWDFAAGAKDKCDDGFTDAGLAIDDPTVDGDKQPHWGPYDASHRYQLGFVGKGAPIAATIHDAAPGNNTGMLTLEIWGPR